MCGLWTEASSGPLFLDIVNCPRVRHDRIGPFLLALGCSHSSGEFTDTSLLGSRFQNKLLQRRKPCAGTVHDFAAHPTTMREPQIVGQSERTDEDGIGIPGSTPGSLLVLSGTWGWIGTHTGHWPLTLRTIGGPAYLAVSGRNDGRLKGQLKVQLEGAHRATMRMGEGTGLAASTALSPRTHPPLSGSFHLLVLCIATCATKLSRSGPISLACNVWALVIASCLPTPITLALQYLADIALQPILTRHTTRSLRCGPRGA